jgi:aspartate aminotransferase-like enzyme
VTRPWNELLDPPEFSADRYAPLADRIAHLLETRADIVFVQAEAVAALEAAATSLARPGLVVLNIVTSFYGTTVGAWLRRAGAAVHQLQSAPGRPVTISAVAKALDDLQRVDVVAWTHGESSTGVVNPLDDIAALARAKGAITLVDAVASAGAHTLNLDAIDVTIIGPQKALAGPSGVSMVACSERAWAHMSTCATPDPSLLSLTGIKRDWLDRGRGALPGTPAALEFWALDAAIARAEAEGLKQIIARHQAAALATRAGLRTIGVAPWIEDDAQASYLATTIVVPEAMDADTLVAAAASFGIRMNHAGAPMRGRLVRFDHMGRGASTDFAVASIKAFEKMLNGQSP